MSLSSCDNRRRTTPQRGLTLLELIVVLGILAALSTIAIRSMEPLADQARYEATQRLLDRMREATVGDPFARQANGVRLISGYVADTGSLPVSLDDLSAKPAGVISYAAQTFDSDRDSVDDVSLSSGWNGPYLLLGAGQSSVLDGWGRAPQIDPDGGDFDFRSLGSDGDSVLPEDGYQVDISVVMPASTFTSSVTVFRVFAIDGTTGTRIDPAPTASEQLGVLVYSANGNGGTTGAIEEVMLPIAATGTFEATKTNVLHGSVAARAFQWTDTNADDQLDVGEPITLSSYIHYFQVIGGIDARIEMELR